MNLDDFNPMKYKARSGSVFLTELQQNNLETSKGKDKAEVEKGILYAANKSGHDTSKQNNSCIQLYNNYYGLRDTYKELMEQYRKIMIHYNLIVNLHNKLANKCVKKN